MITIVNGTNRSGNLSQIIAQFYKEELLALGVEDVRYISMEDLPSDILNVDMFTSTGRSEKLTQIQEEIIIPSEKFIFVLAEYNGGMPGILKLFIDACSTYRKDDNFMNKKVGMIGVAAGRAGNLRGMEHLTGVMNYLGAVVMPNRLPISMINALVNPEDAKLLDQATQNVLSDHAKSFITF